jgi:transketolase
MHAFSQKYPDRFWNVGIAEQNMAGLSAGLSFGGLIPFAATYGVFWGRAWDQVRVSICISNANVKMISTHCGVTVGEDGATAQALEDVGMFASLPNLTILSPCDDLEAYKATLALAEFKGPVYMRLSRSPSPRLTKKETPFVIGRAEIMRKGKDVTLIGYGPILARVLRAAEELRAQNIDAEVINCHTIKPLDTHTILQSAKKTGAVVVVEDHQKIGGIGSMIAAVLAEHHPTPMKIVAVNDRFGESGKPEELLDLVGLTVKKIVEKVDKNRFV